VSLLNFVWDASEEATTQLEHTHEAEEAWSLPRTMDDGRRRRCHANLECRTAAPRGGHGMSVSPLAERVYQTLLRRLRLSNPLISYGDLVRALGPLPPPNNDLQPNDERLFEALEEIARKCQSHAPPLPVLTALVVRRNPDGTLGTPGAGHFALVVPHVGDEAARIRMWRAELTHVVACSYPQELTAAPDSRARISRTIPRWLHEPTVIAAIIGVVGSLLAVIIPLWVAARRAAPSQRDQADRVVVEIVPQSNRTDQSSQQDAPGRTKEVRSLDEILRVLERHHQRATFGAVAGSLGREPRSLFNGYPRTPRTAWVVNRTTGLPTGTKEADYPAGLRENEHIIDASDELVVWLDEHQ
jgi:hypothetical protein